MKFLSFVTSISFASLINCQIASPSLIENADIVERDLNVPSLVSELLDGFDVADVISSINYEKIAGWANNLLTENDNIDILDNILVSLKDTKILPDAAVYIVTHNSTLEILKESLPTVLKVAGKVNTTSLFVALDRSGLAYSVVAGALTDEQFLPSVLEIAQKLIKSGGIDLKSLLEQAGQLISGTNKRESLLLENFESGIESFQAIEKRDNIEDLLTTVFSSVERSGLVNDTIISLLTNDQFQDATVVLIQGAFQNIGSIISGTNFSALKPVLTSLLQSGLLQNTLERALHDEGLRKALTSDLASLLKQGTIKQTDLVSKEDAQSVLAMDFSMESTTSGESFTSFSTFGSSITVDSSSIASPTSSLSESAPVETDSPSSSSDNGMASISSSISILAIISSILLSLI